MLSGAAWMILCGSSIAAGLWFLPLIFIIIRNAKTSGDWESMWHAVPFAVLPVLVLLLAFVAFIHLRMLAALAMAVRDIAMNSFGGERRR